MRKPIRTTSLVPIKSIYRRLLLVFLIIIAIATCGCSKSIEVGDSLDLGQVMSSKCVGSGSKKSIAIGHPISCISDKPVTITEVSLVNAVDMIIIEAVLVSVEPGESYLGSHRWPPPDDVQIHWKDRIKAEGAVLKPDEIWNLVVGLQGNVRETRAMHNQFICGRKIPHVSWRQTSHVSLGLCPQFLRHACPRGGCQ